ncbi:bifunctional DNA primase/polymerase [Streptomyces sp. LP05-1]|uniref:Bifunctional DNA primase/polymerase n=1 Tax=Streptomyces pyxinae TaxID=2970734 RepID=A0ABT2CEF0_9ACTN|nr:bifunctional DNA primase/polymerase [Streptomyces sp. LP05-1]MCS0635116.1 bifunctional DNA primase/polymerase [Streptomyces sp. LP05-1]
MATTHRQAPATPALTHALSAAAHGLPVFPLSPGKQPAVRSPHRDDPGRATCRGECGRPGHGVHDATTDPAAVRALFAAAPRATGYGIACGRDPYHLIGIDLDRSSPLEPASAVELRQLALQQLFAVPDTVTVLTPSGGRHLWLAGPPATAVPNSAGRLAPGVDVRGAGGYLVGPGSVTARGAYRLLPGTGRLPPARCPDALLRLLAPAPAPAPAPRPTGHPASGQGLLHFVLAAREGQRNTRLFWAACRACEHDLGPAFLDALADAAVRTGLPAPEARATIASATRLTTPARRA